MRRLGEVFGILIVVALGFQFLSTPEEAEVRPSIPREELNISGIRLGDSREKVEGLYGEADSREDDGGLRWSKAGLEVRTDQNGAVCYLHGNSLSLDEKVVLSASDPVIKGFQLLGEERDQQEVIVDAMCGFSAPTHRTSYRFQDLGLYVESESSGFFWQSEERLSGFLLCDQDLELIDCPFPLYQEVVNSQEP